MAQLTWREMSAPDFSTASRNYGEFGRMFSDGLGGIRSAVNGFDQARSDEVNNQLAVALASAKDAAAAREMIASGQVGGINIQDPGVARRLNATTLAAISPASMAALQTSQVAAEEARTNQAQRAALDPQAPTIAKIYDAARVGNSAEVQRLLGSLDYTGVGVGAVNNLNTNVQNTERNQVSTDTSRFSLMTDKEAYTNAATIADMISQLHANTMNADDARTWINDPNGPLAKQNPRVRAAVEAQAQSMYPGVFGTPGEGAAAIAGAVGATGGGGGGGVGGAFAMNAPQQAVASEFTKAGLPPAVVAGFLGNFHVEGGYGGATGDGGSAAGIAQWREGRRDAFVKRYGMDPSKAPPDIQAQHVLWELTTAEGRKVAGISEAQSQAIMNAKTPEEAAELIDKYYERSSGKHRPDRVAAARSASQLLLDNRSAQRQLAVRSMQDNAHGLNIDFATTMNDTRDVGQMAAELTGANGAFRGTSRGFLIDQINRIMREGKVNAATAAAVLTRNIDGVDRAPWWNVPGNIRNTYNRVTSDTANLGGDVRLNDRGVSADIALLSEMGAAGIQQQMSAQDARVVDQGQLAAARATFQSAQAQLAQARMRIANGQRGLVAMLPRYEAQVAAAEQQMVMLEALAAQPANRPR